jgi:arylsulfotransferase ASST/type IX secretion system substrate protein
MTSNKYCRLFNPLITLLILFPGISLSQNFPDYHLTIYDSTVTGYYFLSTSKLGINQTGYTRMQLVIDAKGDLIYYNTFLNNASSMDFKVQPNGVISYYKGDKYFLADSTFTVFDSVYCTGHYTDAHDLQIVNNNHYLFMALEDSIMDLSSYNYFNHNGSPGSPNASVTGVLIQEQDANKNVVFEWRSLTHFQFDDVDEYWLNGPNNVDWTHSNAVEMDADGNILLSSRHFNEITKIDHATGNILWRLGGKENQFTFYNDSLIFRGQHDIRRIANGNITFFDNGQYTNPHGARGVEYLLDETNKTATLVWSYTHDPNLYSNATGNNQRVNGSRRLINYGHRSFGDLCFSFIDSLNNPLSELSFTDSSGSYRVFFYPSLPWSFHRPQLTCYQQGTDFYLATTTPYSSYAWSTGATTASVQITATGNYSVFVPYGEGFISSPKFEVLSMSNPCSTTSANEPEMPGSSISIYPNPFLSDFTLKFSSNNSENIRFAIYDVTGKAVREISEIEPNTSVKIYSSLSPGIYFIHATQGDFTKVMKIVKYN